LASTVTGPISDLAGLSFNPRVEFWPLSTPYNSGNTNVVGPMKSVQAINGNFSQVLLAGTYRVKFPPTTNSFLIVVPNDTSTYSLSTLSSNVASVASITSTYFVTQSGLAAGSYATGGKVRLIHNGVSTNSFTTITGAVAAAVSGDLVVVSPGLYTNQNNLLKQGVNIFGEVGAHLLYIQTTTNDAGWGLFDDRSYGATTNTIIWNGNMTMIALTNMSFYNTVADDGTFPFNLNTAGAIVLTNPASRVTIKSKGDLSYTGCSLDVVNLATILAVKGQHVFEFKNITNVLHGITLTAGASGQFPLVALGLETDDADVSLVCNVLHGDGYSWFWHSSNLAVTNDVYITADKISGPMYGDSASDNTRGWVRASKLDTDGIGTGVGIGAFGSGKWYFDILKIKSENIAFRTQLGALGVKTNAQMWVTSQKVEPGTGYADALAGSIYMNILHGNGGTDANGITVSGNGRVYPVYSVSGRTNISAAASSVVVRIDPPMLGTNYTPTASLSFNPVAIMSVGTLTRSNFTITFSTGVTTGGSIFWTAKQNSQ